MASEWRPVPADANCGVAIANYLPGKIESLAKDPKAYWHLNIHVGAVVDVWEETEEWYFGRSRDNPSLRGVLPKAFVRLYAHNERDTPPIVQQIDNALSQWYAIMTELMAKNDKYEGKEVSNKIIQRIMTEVISQRDLLVSNKLSRLECREESRKAIDKIAVLNHQLGLDLIVRDKAGNVLTKDK